jgi:uncharacterized protein (TIGR03492 family)
MRLLCLSNGHGEDTIALHILQELQQFSDCPELAVLPLVGEGQVYGEMPRIGSAKAMPSGGFIYMDGRQLTRDLQQGLLQLTWTQWQSVQQWSRSGGSILAVGDIVPLLLANLSGLPYAFVGTAKSEYQVCDENGWLPRETWWQRLEGWSGSVYHPWERWLMQSPRCRAVFPRDGFTAQILRQFQIPTVDAGNPMMDGLDLPTQGALSSHIESLQAQTQRSLTLVLLPGSRSPEAYANWQQILAAAQELIQGLPERSLILLGAIAPSLGLEPLHHALMARGWRCLTSAVANQFVSEWNLSQGNAHLVLTQEGFQTCLHQAELGITMAGTATEQFVGLGKPAIALPGNGPQFTDRFAEIQSRLLGPSLLLVRQPQQIVDVVRSLLNDPDRLQAIAANGRLRMGNSGAARRIAECLMQYLVKDARPSELPQSLKS